jgi:tripartite-type tricarboxylate transporter receptor subunit TctC
VRHKFLIAALLVVFSTTLAQAQSESWPTRPIKFIVNVAAGGGTDIIARILADQLSRQLPNRVIVENMGGGGGVIAAKTVARIEPDGYTLLFVGPGHASLPYMHKVPPYDPIGDFAPVSLITKFPLVFTVRPELPANTLQEFIALVKAAPDKYTFGSSGVGGNSHMPVEMFMDLAKVKMIHVPFRGGSQSSTALLAGQIDLIIDGLAPQLANIADHRVKILGVTTKERTPFMPDVPAMSEVLPGYQFPMWMGIFAPAKTPKPIIDKLAREIHVAIQSDNVRKRYDDLKIESVGSTPEEFGAFFKEQLNFAREIIDHAHIQLDN